MQKNTWPVESPEPLLPFLLSHVKGLSRNSVKNLLSGGKVLVDGKRVNRHDFQLSPGETVSLAPRDGRSGDPKRPKLPFPILYEDGDLLAVDKPAGLLSIATDTEKSVTAYHMATDYVRSGDPNGRVFIVHRLDRDTSGVLLFAKTVDAKDALQADWQTAVQRRGYLAVVEGAPPEESGTIRSFLRETTTHLVYSAPSGGKEAVTHYRVTARRDGYSLLDVSIDTGRKNQIRVHMADLGCPVVGDKKYGAKGNPMKRLGLHASELTFQNPLTGKTLSLTAPAPGGFYQLTGKPN